MVVIIGLVIAGVVLLRAEPGDFRLVSPFLPRTTVTYFCLIILLRFAGQRTLAKWYAFDLIVTVERGSTFANGVLSNSITVTQS